MISYYTYYSIINLSLFNFPSPLNLNTLWNLGFILFAFFIFQSLSGLFISLNIDFIGLVFSKLVICNEIVLGWLPIKLHTSLSEVIFILISLHIFKSLLFSTYSSLLLWSSGFVLFSLFILSSFLGYSCAGGIMGYWGVTIGSNISRSIIGQYVSNSLFFDEIIGVNQQVLNKLFILHMSISYLVLLIILLHLYILHSEGSSNVISSVSFDINRFTLLRLLSDLESLLLFSIFYLFIIFSGAINNNGESYKLLVGKVSRNLELYTYVRVLFVILRVVSLKLIGVLFSSFVILLTLFSLINSKNLLGIGGSGIFFTNLTLLFSIIYILQISNYFFITYIFFSLLVQLLVLIYLTPLKLLTTRDNEE